MRPRNSQRSDGRERMEAVAMRNLEYRPAAAFNKIADYSISIASPVID
jgi:hypothetical protein